MDAKMKTALDALNEIVRIVAEYGKSAAPSRLSEIASEAIAKIEKEPV